MVFQESKKGQAALEFLMTYGWAILVVLVVIGSLAYFGVLSPDSFLPERCTFKTGIVCLDKQVLTDGTVKLKINNGLGTSIRITEMSVTDKAGLLTVDPTQPCKSPVTDPNPAAGSTAQGVFLAAGQEGTLSIKCDAPNAQGMKPGVRVKAEMTIRYVDIASGFDHTTSGVLFAELEQKAAS